jgi:hypothetical protein
MPQFANVEFGARVAVVAMRPRRREARSKTQRPGRQEENQAIYHHAIYQWRNTRIPPFWCTGFLESPACPRHLYEKEGNR